MSSLSSNPNVSENIYHVLLITSHISKNPNGETEKIQVLGSYASLEIAKAAAQSCLFDAGYEKEWFREYKTRPEELEQRKGPYRTPGLAVLAVAPDGTAFRVHILTTPNTANWEGEKKEGEEGQSGLTPAIPSDLYYVVQTTFEYEDSDEKDINVEGMSTSYHEARELASRVLLSPEDGIDKNSFARYDEAKANEADCGFGENIIVHAVGGNGENYLVGVLPGQTLSATV